MKNTIFYLCLLSLGFLLACEKDPCAELECLNGGQCLDGLCDCPEGYIGADCGIGLDPCAQADCDPLRTDSCLALSFSEARCICIRGFEGDKCEDRWEDKFVGSYNASEVCNGTGELFPMTLSIGPDPQTITLAGLNNQSGVATKVVGSLINATVFDIKLQFMAFGSVSGAGLLENGTNVNVNYQIITTANDTLLCSAALTPQ